MCAAAFNTALDDDVAAKIQAKVRRSGRPFKEVVTEALRAGLALENRAKALPPFKIPPEHLITLKQAPNYDKIEAVFDELDTPSRLR